MSTSHENPIALVNTTVDTYVHRLADLEALCTAARKRGMSNDAEVKFDGRTMAVVQGVDQDADA